MRNEAGPSRGKFSFFPNYTKATRHGKDIAKEEKWKRVTEYPNPRESRGKTIELIGGGKDMDQY
jgi:hypothetical protein